MWRDDFIKGLQKNIEATKEVCNVVNDYHSFSLIAHQPIINGDTALFEQINEYELRSRKLIQDLLKIEGAAREANAQLRIKSIQCDECLANNKKLQDELSVAKRSLQMVQDDALASQIECNVLENKLQKLQVDHEALEKRCVDLKGQLDSLHFDRPAK